MKNSDFKVVFNDDFNYQVRNLAFYIYYKFGNSNAARKLYYKILDAANSLNIFPERHPAIETKKATKDVMRKFAVDKYLITYFVDNKEKTVYINNLLTSK